MLQHRLVDGFVALEEARGLLHRAAAIEAAGGRAEFLAGMAKLSASRAAQTATQDGMQLMAAYVGQVAPSSYITNAACFEAAWFLASPPFALGAVSLLLGAALSAARWPGACSMPVTPRCTRPRSAMTCTWLAT